MSKGGGRVDCPESPSQAAKRLFELYADEIFQYVRFALGSSAQAEDLVQDIFLDALRSWPHYDGSRSSERTWLWLIVRRRLCDRLRRRGRERSISTSDTVDYPGERLDPDVRLDTERLLLSLPAAQRQVIVLRVLQDRSSAQTARILGWTEIKVRVTLHRALKSLERRMVPDLPGSKGDGVHEPV